MLPLQHHMVPKKLRKYERPADCPRTYSRGMLLAYSASALVAKPADMAPLREWYGDWVKHKDKPAYIYHDTPRRGHADEPFDQTAEGDEAPKNGGILGGALGGFGPRREGAGARFGGRRNEDRDRGEGLRLGEVASRRVAPAGKNPFGQISASGTFKPAGTPGGGRGLPRDANADGFGEGRRSGMGERSASFGKDRMRETFPDDRRRDPARERRRGERALDADESREEGEIVDSPRVRRTGGADTASDWRRPGDRDRAGPFSSIASDRLRPGERRGGQRTGGAPWAGDADDNPAWLDDDSEPLPVDNRAPFGQFGTRRREDGLDDPSRGDDMAGAVDSIQAFKAQMKERERRERLARGEPEPVDHGSTQGARSASLGTDREASGQYSFGGEAASQQAELDAIRQEMMADANQRSSSGTSLYDSISNSHGGPGADGQGPPGLPGRSSRFARFFDGRGAPPRDPQAAALAAQQRMLESMGNRGSANATSDAEKEAASVQSPQSPPNAPSTSINISDLFSKTSIRDKGEADQKDASGKNVSEADQQSMQKLMAMLQGGGGSGGSGSGTPTLSRGPDVSGDDRSYQRPEAAERLKELLRNQGRGGEDGLGERPRSMVSPGLASVETPQHGMDARSPLPYNQQHQRESSTSSALGHQQQQHPHHHPQQQQHHQQQQSQQHEQYPQYQQQPQRSDSPATGGYNDPRQQLGGVGSPTSPVGPGLAGFGGFPGSMPGRPPPPGMDPRLLGRPPIGGPGFQQLPPHIAASLGLARGPMPPGMGNLAPPPPPPPMRVPPNGGFLPPFPPPGMPPQLYQQLMSMPPHLQQQVLSGQQQGFPPGMPPRPDASSPYYAGPTSPHQQHNSAPPQVSVGTQAINGANLMALLSSNTNAATRTGSETPSHT